MGRQPHPLTGSKCEKPGVRRNDALGLVSGKDHQSVPTEGRALLSAAVHVFTQQRRVTQILLLHKRSLLLHKLTALQNTRYNPKWNQLR